MNIFDKLNRYRAWTLERFEQPFDNGRVIDIVYGCKVLIDSEWTPYEYGSTPELAFERAIAPESTCGSCGCKIEVPKHVKNASGIVPVCFNCMRKAQDENHS